MPIGPIPWVISRSPAATSPSCPDWSASSFRVRDALALFLEGGYERAALQESVAATLGALLAVPTDLAAPTYGGPGMSEIRSAVSDRHRAMERLRLPISSEEDGA